MQDIEAYSSTTGKTYPNWDALVEAEANGYLCIAIITGRRGDVWPWVVGPFPTKAEAERHRTNLRAKWNRQKRQPLSMYAHQTYKFFVRPAWKDDR